MSPVLTVDRLAFAYDSRPVFADLSIEVAEGECVGLAGPNGAGKSTLLWCVAGLLKPHRGTVSRPEHGRIAMVFQNPEDQLFMPTLADDLTLPLWNAGLERGMARTRALKALAAVGLEDHADRSAEQLSLGQRKRAAIALALVGEPDLLLLDEPTSELDARSVRQLAGVLRAIRAAKLVSSHHIEFLRKVCDRVVILDGGGIAASGPAADLLNDADLLRSHGLL